MKSLREYLKRSLDESLIKSYDADLLKRKLEKKYNISKFHNIKFNDTTPAKSDNVKRFSFELSVNDYDVLFGDETKLNEFVRLLNFYGYYITEINYVKDKKLYDIHVEPIFSKKCNDLVYDKCNGIIWHATDKYYVANIYKKGIRPFKGETYRSFSERAFFTCGETNEEIISNLKNVIKQKNKSNYHIFKINLTYHREKPYDADFYYDTSEENFHGRSDHHNCIYANAVIFPQLIEDEYTDINDLEEKLNSVVEQKIINGQTIILKNI